MGNTGFKKFSMLEQYYLDDNTGTGVTKANNIDDLDYIAPVYDPSTCAPEVRYYSEARAASAIKSNCNPGYGGSTVVMRAMPAQFVSTISLDDANAKADTWLAENKQAYANLTGTCTAYYPITGCHFRSEGSSTVVCSTVGTETYYNTTGKDGWDVGDVIYTLNNGVYEALVRVLGTTPYVSYTRAGIRTWVGLDYFTSVVNSIGICDMNSYTAVGGCYMQEDGESESTCAITSNEVYYNNTGIEGWDVGDTVYEYSGGAYVPLILPSDATIVISYTRNGTRSWVRMPPFGTGVVESIGECSVKGPIIIFGQKQLIAGTQYINFSASSPLTSNIDIRYVFQGQSSNATIEVLVTYYASSGTSQSNTFAFDRVPNGFTSSEFVYMGVVSWSPTEDAESVYIVENDVN